MLQPFTKSFITICSKTQGKLKVRVNIEEVADRGILSLVFFWDKPNLT